VKKLIIFVIIGIVCVAGTYLAYRAYTYLRYLNDPRSQSFMQWATGSAADRSDLITVQREACPGAPFILPSDGFIGLLYEDPRGPYSSRNPHQGIDIFSNTDPGINPVYAAYDGFVTREKEWKSSLIIRVPDDPLNPGEQIWLYHTHMADRKDNDFTFLSSKMMATAVISMNSNSTIPSTPPPTSACPSITKMHPQIWLV
jgi:hypothetical protein